MAVKEYGEGLAKGLLSVILCQGSVLVVVVIQSWYLWDGISMEAFPELVVVNGGAMTANRYITNILEPHVVPFAPFIGNDSILMQDNARPHITQIVNEYLDTVEFHHMVWPARSPDLNPIGHVWDMVGRRVKVRTPAPANLRDLSAAVIQE
jgi:hypothetical protein